MRYLAPPAAVVAIGRGSASACVAGRVTGSRFLQLGALAPAGYGAFVAYVTAIGPRTLSPEARRWLPAVLAATHLAWGSGFLVAPPLRSLSRSSTPRWLPAPRRAHDRLVTSETLTLCPNKVG